MPTLRGPARRRHQHPTDHRAKPHFCWTDPFISSHTYRFQSSMDLLGLVGVGCFQLCGWWCRFSIWVRRDAVLDRVNTGQAKAMEGPKEADQRKTSTKILKQKSSPNTALAPINAARVVLGLISIITTLAEIQSLRQSSQRPDATP